jgi:hypothetical protein
MDYFSGKTTAEPWGHISPVRGFFDLAVLTYSVSLHVTPSP